MSRDIKIFFRRIYALAHTYTSVLVIPCLVLAGVMFLSPLVQADEVNIYSYRQSHLIEPLLNKFSQDTGIKTNAVFVSQGIAEKLRFEGKNSPADIVLTVDIYRLAELKEKGLTRSVTSDALTNRIPAAFRDISNHWFALTQRSRVIFATSDTKRAPFGEVSGYLDLAKPNLGKRVCTRTLSHIYNLGLISSLIAQYGEERADKWLRGLKKNLARRPQGNDREQIKAITSGQCDYAVANSYYFNLLTADDPKWTKDIRWITPKSDKGGTHMNVSGMAMTRHSPNPENALKLMEFLSSDWAQQTYASYNNEIPIIDTISSSAREQLGDFERQPVAIETLATFINKAQDLVISSKIDLR